LPLLPATFRKSGVKKRKKWRQNSQKASKKWFYYLYSKIDANVLTPLFLKVAKKP
jgi:hypothetical protein